MGLFFAILSMVAAGLADFVFRGYFRRSGQAMGNFLAGVGLVWTAAFAVPIILSGEAKFQAWPISLAAGLCSIGANVFLSLGMRRLDTGVCSTVYRLNLVLVVFLAAIVLNEPITVEKLAAVTLGVIAVVLVFQPGQGDGEEDEPAWKAVLPFGALIAAAGLRATMGVFYKIGINHGVGDNEFLMISGLCWLAGGVVFGLVRSEPLVPTRRGWRFAGLAGLIICADVLFLFLANRFGQASVVIPVSQLGFTIALILGWLVLGERMTVKRVLALAAALGCILVMSRA